MIISMVDSVVHDLSLTVTQVGKPVNNVEQEESEGKHHPGHAVNVRIPGHRFHRTLAHETAVSSDFIECGFASTRVRLTPCLLTKRSRKKDRSRPTTS